MATVFFSAGEVSGDVFCSQLILDIKSLNPFVNCVGIGGPLMARAGQTQYFNFIDKSAVGLTENIKSIPFFLKKFNETQKLINILKPDLIVLVDFQGFNIRLADFARLLSIPVIYYIPPQDWIWGFKNGLSNISKKVDHILAILPQEYQAYLKAGANVSYVGHPLTKILSNIKIKDLDHINQKKKICILPGSRMIEVRRLLPPLVKLIKRINNHEDFTIYLPIASEYLKPIIKQSTKGLDITLIQQSERYSYMLNSDLCIIASGNATLEAALLNIPSISIYKVSKLTYSLARVLIKSPYFSLPNILLNQSVIPELIQEEVNVEKLYELSSTLLYDKKSIHKQKQFFRQISRLLQPNQKDSSPEKIIMKYL